MDKITTIITIEPVIRITTETIIQNADKISTLKTPNLTNKRRDGNSTRQIDFAIQKLFEGYIVVVEDHYFNKDWRPDRKASEYLFKRIIDRIKFEHSYIDPKKVLVNKSNLTIEFI